MYISTYTALNTALSGIEVSQEELDTTGDNIANENTAGYVEQTVNETENPELNVPAGTASGAGEQIGTGVNATSITNDDDPYLDAQYQTQNAAASNASTEQTYLTQLQSALDEPSDNGISTQLSTFWSAWSSLADDPTSAAAKQEVVSDGTELAQSFNSLSSDLSTLSSQATSQYNSLTGTGGEVETDANQVAQLNSAIKEATADGEDANALIDQRTAAINQLSSLASVTTTANSDGTVTVGFGDAASPLVSGSTVNWPQTITSAAGGTLGALLNLTEPGGQIAQYSSQLDSVAGDLATEVNGVSGMSTDFFSGTTASTLAVNVTASQVTASSDPTTDPGGNGLATAVAALQGGTADQAYDTFVAQVGDGVDSAQSTSATASALLTSIQNQQQSTEGVDLSQEMENLIQEQQAYQASSQVMNTFSTMIDSLLSAVGGS